MERFLDDDVVGKIVIQLGVERSGGRLRASATLLDSPAMCLMAMVNWEMNSRCLSARKVHVEVEWALVMELVRGF